MFEEFVRLVRVGGNRRTRTALAALVSLGLILAASCDEGGQESGERGTTGGGSGQQSGSGKGKKGAHSPTVAPDLGSVGNFRPGPPDDEGKARTSVDFTFDQKAFLTGSNRTSFHLVPEGGGEVLDGSDASPKKDREGDNIVVVVFPGKLEPEDFARGYVDKAVLGSDKQGDAPTNVAQAESVADKGTPGPDLVSVAKDADQFLFEFDQPLTQEYVVQNTGGLRLYFPDTRQTGATAVDKTDDPKVLRATFKQLPEDHKPADVVGGYTTQGAVQGKEPGSTNAFDEVAPVGDTGAKLCPAPKAAGRDGKGDGPTEAPDLVSVGNFRRGPVTDQGEPRTCVDFVFDQKAYLKGSNRTSFHLAPADGSDALDAADVIPESDKDGDAVITAVFPGKLDPARFPRGYLDRGVVTSRKKGANKDDPSNIEQAATISNEGRTKNPDLVSVTRDGDQVLYKFDEALTKEDVIQNTGGLRLYFAKTNTSNIKQAGSLSVKRKNATTLRAYFGKDLPNDKMLGDAVGGFAKQGVVQAAKGSRGDNDGKSAFDEVAPLR